MSKRSKPAPKLTQLGADTNASVRPAEQATKQATEQAAVGSASPALILIDRLAAQVSNWPRGVRVVVAGLITLVVTGLVGLVLFSVLFQIPAQRLTWWFINPSNISAVVLTALVVVGIVMYWVSWSVLVGFDLADTPLVVGRAGVVWILFGVLVLCAIIALIIISTAIAVQEQ